MREHNAQKIVDHDNLDGGEMTICTNYSGRGMYGQQTTGVVADNAGTVYAIAGKLGIETDAFRTDSLGLRTIVY